MAQDWYIGVGGKARRVVAAYIGVNGKARRITSGYFGIGGKARQFFSDGKIEFVKEIAIRGFDFNYEAPCPIRDYYLLLGPSSDTNVTREVIPIDRSYVVNDIVEGLQFPRSSGLSCSIDDDYAISVRRSSSTSSLLGTPFRYDNNLVRVNGDSSVNIHKYGGYTSANRKAYLGLGISKYGSPNPSSSSGYLKTIDILSEDLVKTGTLTDNDHYDSSDDVGALSTTDYAVFIGYRFYKAIDKNDICTTVEADTFAGTSGPSYGILNNVIYIYSSSFKYKSLDNNLVFKTLSISNSIGVSKVSSKKWFSKLSARQSNTDDAIFAYWDSNFVSQTLDFTDKVSYEEERRTLTSRYWPSAKVGMYMFATKRNESGISAEYKNGRIVIIQS